MLRQAVASNGSRATRTHTGRRRPSDRLAQTDDDALRRAWKETTSSRSAARAPALVRNDTPAPAGGQSRRVLFRRRSMVQ
jgi:hypothetical protein